MAGNQADVGYLRFRSTQEIRHQDNDGGDDCDHHFRQGNESLVRLFVSGVIVALRGRIFDFGVIGHPSSPNGYSADADLA
jgi:hypothetical protein